MDEPGPRRPVRPDRRWVLVGMAVGTALGALPGLIPAPVGPVLTWACYGTFVGVGGMVFLLHAPGGRTEHRVWWWLTGGGAVAGGLVGAVLGAQGRPVPAESVAATCTCGFFAGYAVAEAYLRRREARARAAEAGQTDNRP